MTISCKTRPIVLLSDSSKHYTCPLNKLISAFKVVKLFLKQCINIPSSLNYAHEIKKPLSENLQSNRFMYFLVGGNHYSRTCTLTLRDSTKPSSAKLVVQWMGRIPGKFRQRNCVLTPLTIHDTQGVFVTCDGTTSKQFTSCAPV
jgi:hypothetical protein